MHDLKAIYKKVKAILKTTAKEYFEFGENSKFYPNKPKLSDLEIVSLAITAEAVQIDSENLLWSKIKTDYPTMFADLPHRTRFNKRRKNLRLLIQNILDLISEEIEEVDNLLIIDSMPLTTCKIVRERMSKACRRENEDELVANKGYSAMLNGYYIGYKFHLIVSSTGVYKDYLITPANVHDTAFLKEINKDDQHLKDYVMLGDRGYIGKATQLRLFDELGLDLNIPYRRNQKDYKKYPYELKIKRKKLKQYSHNFAMNL